MPLRFAEQQVHYAGGARGYDEVPPRVEYSLTPLGVSLNEALAPLGAWGRENVLAHITHH